MDNRLIPDPPIHPLSAFVTIVLDGLWFLLEAGVTMSVAALAALLPIIGIAGLTGFVTVSLIQRFVARDEWGAAVAKGLAMGVVAAAPYPVLGTVLGGVLLGWAGTQGLESIARRLLQPRRPPPGKEQ